MYVFEVFGAHVVLNMHGSRQGWMFGSSWTLINGAVVELDPHKRSQEHNTEVDPSLRLWLFYLRARLRASVGQKAASFRHMLARRGPTYEKIERRFT